MERNPNADVEWWYEGDEGWKKMTQPYSDMNEEAFLAGRKILKYEVPFGEDSWWYSYEIDFEAMTQKNVDTNKMRSLHRWAQEGGGAQIEKKIAVWEFQSEQGWVSMDAFHTDLHERHWHCTNGCFYYTVKYGKAKQYIYEYEVKLETMTQWNRTTDKERPLRRLVSFEKEVSPPPGLSLSGPRKFKQPAAERNLRKWCDHSVSLDWCLGKFATQFPEAEIQAWFEELPLL